MIYFMIYCYRVFYTFLKTLLLLLKPLLPGQLKSWLQLRAKKIDPGNRFKNTYWFHASSGEVEYCKSVIRQLKEQKPEAQIVITYSSPSAEKLFHNITDYVNQFIALGWDQPASVNKLIDYLNPKILIFSRTDFWPELITQAKKRNIKMGVISFNPNFSLGSRLSHGWLLPKFDFISCISTELKDKLSANPHLKNITADGDTRYDQVFHRLSQQSKIKFLSHPKIFVCGSTWPEDEAILFECFTELIRNNFKIILSPHQIQTANIVRLEKELTQRGLNYQLLSKENDFLKISLDKNILIVDKIGFLADIYRDAAIAFVGGSFKKRIHSVMEPLCCGLPVITGPYFKNSPEAVKYHKHYVFSVNTSAELIFTFNKSLRISNKIISDEMKKNTNASKQILDLLHSL